MLPPEVSVPADPAGNPITLASQSVHAFSIRTAPGLAEAKPEYLFDTAASRSPRPEWNSPPPGI